MVRTLLVCGAVVRLLLTLAHYQMVARFVRSKPPGRKMVSYNLQLYNFNHPMYMFIICSIILQVTSDINVFAILFLDTGRVK